MDTPLRTLVKAVSWQALGLVSMIGLAYLQTGAIRSALVFASSATALGFVCYVLHERLWSHVRWGRNNVPHPGDGAAAP
jgi:uncharacterized membrane protein